jgi:hypothetical protein
MSCFGNRFTKESCVEGIKEQGKVFVDLNYDGVIDGADYNIFLRSLTAH